MYVELSAIGNLGHAAEVKATDGGGQMIKFSIACTQKWKDRTTGEDKESTVWIDCTQFIQANGSTAVAAYLTKGKKVFVKGKPAARAFAGNDGTPRASLDLVLSYIELCDSAPAAGDQQGQYGGQQQAQPAGQYAQPAAGQYQQPAQQYGAPAPQYAAPAQQYGAPQQQPQYQQPAQQPAPQYQQPAQQPAPAPQYQQPAPQQYAQQPGQQYGQPAPQQFAQPGQPQQFGAPAGPVSDKLPF